jgi:hypothetical protein
MNWKTILMLLAWFVLVWGCLYLLAKRYPRQAEPDPRIQELLEHEQAAHDAFQRTARRLKRGEA